MMKISNKGRMIEPRSVRTIAVSGGKGGVGKTSVAVNVAIELARSGQSVLLLDADLGMANIDIMLNIRPKYDLSHVVGGQCALQDIILRGPQGLDIVPASSGLGRMARLSALEEASLIRAFGELEAHYDMLVIDTAAGIAPNVISFTKAAQEVVVVLCDEPTSLADAYALIKVLNVEHGVKRFQVLANKVRGPDHGRALYARLVEVADVYLDASIGYLGIIPLDARMNESIRARAAITERHPYCPASLAFQKLARRLIDMPRSDEAGGFVEFFVEKAHSLESGGVQEAR